MNKDCVHLTPSCDFCTRHTMPISTTFKECIKCRFYKSLQLSLFDKSASDYATKAAVWRKENPECWRWMEQLAEMMAEEYGHISVRDIMALARWKWRKKLKDDGSGYKFNNNMTAHHAHYLKQVRPDLAEYVETR